MVEITNGQITLTVTTGAFKSFYKDCGFAILSTAGGNEDPEVGSTHLSDENCQAEDSSQEENTEEDDEPSYDDEPYEDSEDEEVDLSEIPLSEMNFEQLQEYADQLGINRSGVRSKKELRSLIRQHNAG